MFPKRIETESLLLTQLAAGSVDVFDLYELFRASEDGVTDVFQYIPQEPFRTVNDAREWLVDAEADWEAGDGAKYGVYPAGDALAGTAALQPNWDRRTASLGLILGKPYWEHGYAGECATALADLAFDRLDLEVVEIGYDEGNERSKRAIEKFIDRVGGQYDGVIRNATPRGDEVVDAHQYTVTRDQYRRATER